MLFHKVQNFGHFSLLMNFFLSILNKQYPELKYALEFKVQRQTRKVEMSIYPSRAKRGCERRAIGPNAGLLPV